MTYKPDGDDITGRIESLRKASALALTGLHSDSLRRMQNASLHRSIVAPPPLWHRNFAAMAVRPPAAHLGLAAMALHPPVVRLNFAAMAARPPMMHLGLAAQAARAAKQLEHRPINFAAVAAQQQALLALNSSLASVNESFNRFEDFQRPLRLVDRILEPQRAFVDFAEQTVERLDQSTDEQETKALEVSLELAEAQLLTSAETVSDFISQETEDSQREDGVFDKTPLILPFVQQEELLRRPDGLKQSASEYGEAVPVTQIAQLGRRFGNLIFQCNEAEKVRSGSNTGLFKATDRLILVVGEMPWMLPQDQTTFGVFVDRLFFALYEGAGAENLRYMEKQGGVFSRDDSACSVIWCIKSLRNVLLRHDPEHGEEKAIHKKWATLKKQLDWIGLGHYPVKEEHFRKMHMRLLFESVQFLQTMLDKLTTSAA